MLEFLAGFMSAAVISAITGGVFTARLLKQNNQLKVNLATFERECALLRQNQGQTLVNVKELEASKLSLTKQCAMLTTELANLKLQHEARLNDLKEAKNELRSQFAEVASKIFDEREKVANHNFGQLLNPLKEKITSFEKRVEESYSYEARERFALGKELHNLQQLNQRLSVEAQTLSKALQGQKTQGNWGEMILERILEAAGLHKGREYQTQVALKDESGNRQIPDALISLPGERHIIVDAKVSLTAYQQLQAASDQEQAANYARQHVQSLRNHVKNLSSKQYYQLEQLHSLDLILLFMPIDAALTCALENDPQLFQAAFSEHIVLVSPTTLLTTLKIINSLWQQEKQNKNAREIAEKAGNLYDKLVAFVQDLGEIGSRITQLNKSYDAAYNKLSSGRGNLIRRAEDLRSLGARTNKNLPANLIEQSNNSYALD